MKLPSGFNMGLNTSMNSVLDDAAQKSLINLLVSFTVARKSTLTGLGFNDTKAMGTLGYRDLINACKRLNLFNTVSAVMDLDEATSFSPQ
jgi:hypothetical protein